MLLLSLNYKVMPDDKNNTGRQDDIRIDMNDKNEERISSRAILNKTHEQIEEAIKEAGPIRADIIEYLRKNKIGFVQSTLTLIM